MALIGRRVLQVLIITWLVAVSASVVVADDTAAAGRAVAAKWEKAIVKVQVVLKSQMAYEGREMGSNEQTKEINGTVVDPSGLTLVSLSEISPEDAYDDEEGSDYKTELTDVKIRLDDGQEVPAKVVLRDKDLDMAFIRPREKPTTSYSAVNLSEKPELRILDPVVVLARLGRVANRTLAVSLDSVQAVIEKPRKSYIIDLSSMTDELGAPVFTMDGKLAGVVLLRSIPSSPTSYEWDNEMWVVMPTSEIAEVARQAPEEEAKEPEPPAAEEQKND